jgi:UDP-N-acetylmuramate dehydrogenase
MIVEQNASLQPHNTFGIVAKARTLVRVKGRIRRPCRAGHPELGPEPKFVLGGGSNIVLTGDVKPVVLKVEVPGRGSVEDGPKATIVEFGAGENWHEAVTWTIEQGLGGLENLALIPGTVGASPVQNIGAYGIELQDRFESLDAIDLLTGANSRWTPRSAPSATATRCSSIRRPATATSGLAGRALILRVRHAPAQALEAGARLPGPAAQDDRNRHPPARTRGRSTTGSAPSAAPSCPTRA